jgi:hypothetical protein
LRSESLAQILTKVNKDSANYASIITEEHTPNGSGDTDKPRVLASLGLLNGVEVLDVDLLDRVGGAGIFEVFELFLGIGLGHDAVLSCEKMIKKQDLRKAL